MSRTIQRANIRCSSSGLPIRWLAYGLDKYAATLGPSEHFVKAGYIFVNQDVRGRFMSEGKFVQVTPHIDVKRKSTDIDESSDTYDTIEWLLKNVSGHNGRVGHVWHFVSRFLRAPRE